jgi:hypothetical protein
MATAEAYESAKIVAAGRAALSEVRSGRTSEVPAELKAKKTHQRVFESALAFFKAQRPT